MTALSPNIKPILNWQLPDNVRAVYTTRGHDPHRRTYGAFNLATHVGDEHAVVLNNRRRLAAELCLPTSPLWLNQVHSYHCIDNVISSSQPTADASYSDSVGRVCTVLTADCLPILISSTNGKEIAAIHAGWRGLLNGIITHTLDRFRTPKQELLVWLGPRICGRHYEVGRDLIEKFISADTSYEAAASYTQSRFYFDLSVVASIQLRHAGVKHILDCGACTFERMNGLYSYRRDEITGRFASLIWRTS